MMKKPHFAALFFGLLFVACMLPLQAQIDIQMDQDLPATPVKDQHRTGTCWSFATTSFLESELLRTGKGEYDLAEMYFCRKAYELKAEKYVRLHGRAQFAQGGLAMDVLHIMKHWGMVPGEAYSGHTYGDSLPVHNEMDALLRSYVETVVRNRNGELSTVWLDGYKGILDAYLGAEPTRFTVDGNSHTPSSFAEELGLKPDDYVPVASFSHHPFYGEFILEIPDNWLWSKVLNLPLDEMMEVLDHSLETGYTICWDADVGEKSFVWKSGLARIPVYDAADLDPDRRKKWKALSEKEQKNRLYEFFPDTKEKEITQELRQAWFDNYATTDDHLMHITGKGRDERGRTMYKVKNSWGTEDHIYQGYFFASESYMRAKTIFFLVHRDAIPEEIARRLGW